MPYEEDYKMWLEKALISMNPDWICDEMSENEFTHNWCHQYCGKDDAYITPKCLHMYYHHIEMADRKTENSSEKPNNCEDDEYWKHLFIEVVKGHMSDAEANQAWYEYINHKTEPQTERSE